MKTMTLIRDTYGRICWLGKKADKPDQEWLDSQSIPFRSDANFHSAYPLTGGSVIIDRNLAEVIEEIRGDTPAGEPRHSALVASWYALNDSHQPYSVPEFFSKYYDPEGTKAECRTADEHGTRHSEMHELNEASALAELEALKNRSNLVNMHDSPRTFTVTGKGRFPVDMLRHDVCVPADAEAAEAIENLDNVGVRDVRLTTTKMRFITPDRWRSFGWMISSDIYKDDS